MNRPCLHAVFASVLLASSAPAAFAQTTPPAPQPETTAPGPQQPTGEQPKPLGEHRELSLD